MKLLLSPGCERMNDIYLWVFKDLNSRTKQQANKTYDGQIKNKQNKMPENTFF